MAGLRHPNRGVYSDPRLGFVGVRAAPRWEQHEELPLDGGYSSYSLDENDDYDNRAAAGRAGTKPRGTQPVLAAAGGEGGGALPPAARAEILRAVDVFVMTLPLGATPGDAEIEEAVASRLYRAELGAAEARAKLGDWSRVALELKEVVQQQQAALEAAMGGGGAAGVGRRAPPAAASARPHVQQLQRLVADMRAELRQPPGPAGTCGEPAARQYAPAHGWDNSSDTNQAAAATEQQQQQHQHELQRLHAELAASQAEVRGLRAEHAAAAAARRSGSEEAAAATLQVEHALREADGARAERERMRRALIDAEIELQRKTNDVAALQAKVAAAAQQQEGAAAAAAAQHEAAVAAAAGQLATAQADAASLRHQLAAARAAAEEQGTAAAQAQASCEHLRASLAAVEAATAVQRQQKEACDVLIAQLQSQVVYLQAAASNTSSASAADLALLQEQLAAAAQREAAAAAAATGAAKQVDALKGAHGEALNAARESQAALAAAQEDLAVTRAALEQAQRAQRAAEGGPTPKELAQRDTEISALKAVLDRVATAAQHKDAQVAAAQREAAAAAAEREAALAGKAAAEQQAAEWQQAAAAAEELQAAAQAAHQQAAAAEAALLQAQLGTAADAQRWEEQLLALRSQLHDQQQAVATAGAQQAALQAEVANLRQQLSAKDQQIGALSSLQATDGSSRPGSAGSGGNDSGATAEQVVLQQARLEQLQGEAASLRSALAASDAALAAAEAAAAAAEQQAHRLQHELVAQQAERRHQVVAAIDLPQQLMAAQQARAVAERQAYDSAATATEWRQQAALLRQQLEAVAAAQQQAAVAAQQQAMVLKPAGPPMQAELSEEHSSDLIPAAVQPAAPRLAVEHATQTPTQPAAAEWATQTAAQPTVEHGTQTPVQPAAMEHAAQTAQPAVAECAAQTDAQAAVAACSTQTPEQPAVQPERPVVLRIKIVEAPAPSSAPAYEQRDDQLAALQSQVEQQEKTVVELRQRCGRAEAALAAVQRGCEATAAEHTAQLAAAQLQHERRLEEAHAELGTVLAELQQQHARQLGEAQARHSVEVQRQAELHSAEMELLLSQHADAEAALASAAACAAAAVPQHAGDATPSPVQRRYAQRMRQLREQQAEEAAALAAAHEAALAAERRRWADEAAAAAQAHRRQLELLATEHEQQLLDVRRRAEASAEARELEHLVELEAAVEGGLDGLLGLSGDGTSLAGRLRALEARREQQEVELEGLRAALAEQRSEHESQLAAVMSKQAVLLESLQAESPRAAAALRASPFGRWHSPQSTPRKHAAQQQQPERQHHQMQTQWQQQTQATQTQQAALQEEHAAELARVLTRAIFASVLERAAAAAPPSPGPDLRLPAGEVPHVSCITGASSYAGSRSPPASVSRQQPGSGLRHHCRITAAALAACSSPPSGSRSVRRQLLPPAEPGPAAPAQEPWPGAAPAAALCSDLSQAAEAVGPAAWGPGSFTGAAALAEAAAEVTRLEGELDDTVAECERRGEALRDCQEMVEELQAFAEGQKQQLSEARAEIEDAQRRGREGQARLRGLEEQLLAAQDACGKANSQVTMLERKCAGHREELRSLQSMHDALQSEHTAVCGQLTAAQQQHETALDRLQHLSERLALAQQEKTQAQQQLDVLQRRMEALRDEHSHEAEVLLHELLLQRLRASSAGDSNSGGRVRSGGSGAAAVVLSGSAEEATLAAHLPRQQQQQQQHPDGSGGTVGGGFAGAAVQRAHQRPATAPEPAQLLQQQQQQQQRRPNSAQRQLLAGPSGLPPIATRLPPHLRREATSGSAGGETPLSARSVESAWSDSVAELGPAGSKKKRGALHKLGKILNINKPAPAPAPLGPRSRPNPAALTAPLEHSMREAEAAALQAQVLREQQEAAAAAAARQQRRSSAAELEPAAVPPAIHQPMQQAQQHAQHHQQPQLAQQQQTAQRQQPAQRQYSPCRPQLFSAASAEEAGWAGDYTQQWVQQQAAKVEAELAAEKQAQQAQQQQRPWSGASGASGLAGPPDSGYSFPDVAAAGYAAGVAAMQAESFGMAAAAAGPVGKKAALLPSNVGGGDVQLDNGPSWHSRLHVVHSNALFDDVL